jgi:hypothetical protein
VKSNAAASQVPAVAAECLSSFTLPPLALALFYAEQTERARH